MQNCLLKDDDQKHYSQHTALEKKKLRLDRYIARNKIQSGLLHGTLKRKPCFFGDDTKAEAHHLIYAFPLKVIWVCRTHHIEVHREAKSKPKILK
jgi:hypothetical protein